RLARGEVEAGGLLGAGDQVVGVGDEVVTLRNDRRLMTSAGGWVRNGDRWVVTARHGDGSLAVSHLGGHGRTVLPPDYVAEQVSLAYALTVHKAQGVTVDEAVVVVDETTTAEALYVGMTRGRHDNTAVVCTEALDLEHQPEPTTAHQVLEAALARTTADESALAALDHTLAASESLAVLAPRLASIEAQIRRETPDKPAPELKQLAARRAYLERHRPGILTRAGRDTRRALADLDRRQAALEEARDQRDQWLADHADLFAYRDHLATQVSARRVALGVVAVMEQPDHLVELLGAMPDDEAERRRWTRLASQVEAYREQWGVEPDQLRIPPIDGVQYREWSASIASVETLRRLERPTPELRLERGLELGL
ncbi:MAG: ATP-binding domain-containing protein, partial [Actinobacteria bacterium]|nr:ATP-binding domain-containing protein [Actinomycetota bacterium]